MTFADFVFLTISGVMLAYVPFQALVGKQRLQRRTGRTWGTVEGQDLQSVHGSMDTHHIDTKHPIVSYEVNGRTYRHISKVGASFELVQPGESIQVAYNPRRPTDAQLLHPKLETTETLVNLAIILVAGGVFLYHLVGLFG